MTREYEFIDGWDVEAPILAVFRALSDVTTYPDWWQPVYVWVEADGPLHVGRVARERFRGRLPYEVSTQSRIVRLEPPREVEVELLGDVCGLGIWTLSPLPGERVHVQLDWRLLLTTLQWPAFRFDRGWAIKRAIEGLEPYARASASVPVAAASST